MIVLKEEYVEHLKQMYPQGTRIQLDYMGPDAHPIPPGTKGTVDVVDDIGTIHCRFDNGRYFGIIPDTDRFHMIHERETEER